MMMARMQQMNSFEVIIHSRFPSEEEFRNLCLVCPQDLYDLESKTSKSQQANATSYNET